MNKLPDPEIKEAIPFDDVMRHLLRAKPQPKIAKKSKTAPKRKAKK